MFTLQPRADPLVAFVLILMFDFQKPIKHLTVSRWDYYLLIQDYLFHWWYVCSLAIDFQTLERVKTMFITKLQNPYCVLSIVLAILEVL